MPEEKGREGAVEPNGPSDDKQAWQKPEILSVQPAASTQGISYNPLDGISNLTP
jgi:hypothetical protein